MTQGTINIDDSEPCYVISVAAKLVGVHAQTLRYYERVGLLKPARPNGKIRLYSAKDIARGRQIKRLMEDMGVNLAGVEIILNHKERFAQLEEELNALRQEVARLRALVGEGAETAGTKHSAEGSGLGEPTEEAVRE